MNIGKPDSRADHRTGINRNKIYIRRIVWTLGLLPELQPDYLEFHYSLVKYGNLHEFHMERWLNTFIQNISIDFSIR